MLNANTTNTISLTNTSDIAVNKITIFDTSQDYRIFDSVEIDNFNVFVMNEGSAPTLPITWEKSSNLLMSPSQLGSTNFTGVYILNVLQSYTADGENFVESVYSKTITATQGVDEYTENIDLASTNIVPNFSYTISVTAKSTTQFNGQSVFNNFADSDGNPLSNDTISIIYGEATMTSILPIGILMEYVIGNIELSEEEIQANDFNNDGLLNVSDITTLIQVIIGE